MGRLARAGVARLCPALLAALACLGGGIASISTARAQEDGAQTAARAAFAQGVERYEERNYAGALEAFERAYSEQPHPNVLVNIANCLERLGRDVQALGQFEQFLVQAPYAPEVRLREVRAAITRLTRRTAVLELSVYPSDSLVLVDDEAIAPEAWGTFRIQPGRHRVVVHHVGYASTETTISLRDGEQRQIEILLAPVEPSPEEPPLQALPALADPEETAAAATQEGSGTDRPALAVAARDAGQVATRDPRWLGLRPATALLGGAGVALLAASGGSLLMARSANEEFDNAVRAVHAGGPGVEAAQAAGRDAATRTERWALAADLLAGGALAALGVALYIEFSGDDRGGTERRPQSARTRVRVAPLAGQALGVSATGEVQW